LRPPPYQTRIKLFQRYLDGTAAEEKIVRKLAEEETLTPAVIERAGKVLECLPDRNARTLCRIVSNQLRAQGHAPRPRYPDPADYRLEFINTDPDIAWLETALTDRPSARILLYGPPGTGKTAYAHHLADTLGRPLQFRRASDLLSKWVGETESNIAETFRKAREDDAMIVLDEADSLLQNREYAQQGWEITQVNELLTQMEAFEGIFVCATNFLQHLDRAALRRFSLKIEFGYLTAEQSVRLLQATIDRANNRETDDDTPALIRERLSRIGNLTPGDFTVVRQQAEMFGTPISADELIDSLERECALKSDGGRRPIGFTYELVDPRWPQRATAE
jgi:adenylate kinase family enzyme